MTRAQGLPQAELCDPGTFTQPRVQVPYLRSGTKTPITGLLWGLNETLLIKYWHCIQLIIAFKMDFLNLGLCSGSVQAQSTP